MGSVHRIHQTKTYGFGAENVEAEIVFCL